MDLFRALCRFFDRLALLCRGIAQVGEVSSNYVGTVDGLLLGIRIAVVGERTFDGAEVAALGHVGAGQRGVGGELGPEKKHVYKSRF